MIRRYSAAVLTDRRPCFCSHHFSSRNPNVAWVPVVLPSAASATSRASSFSASRFVPRKRTLIWSRLPVTGSLGKGARSSHTPGERSRMLPRITDSQGSPESGGFWWVFGGPLRLQLVTTLAELRSDLHFHCGPPGGRTLT